MTHATMPRTQQYTAPWLERMLDDSGHTHAPAGSAVGGQFVGAAAAKAAASAQKKPAAKPAKKSATKTPQPASGNLAYDPDSNTGAGYGMKGGDPRVHRLQQALNRLGMTDGSGAELKDDGKLGPKTTAAVKRAQKALGLKPDGVVTPALLEKLTSVKSLRSSLLDVCTRSFGFEFEQRGGDGRTLEGYAAIFNAPTRIRDVGGDFEETILPGAFVRSLKARTPILQWDHGKDPRVGTVPIGAIQDLAEDSRGLHVRARLFDNPVVEPVRQAIEGRAIKGMSFRFGVPDKGDTWTRRSGSLDLREIRDADVHELGPVAFPAYDHTSVTVRDLLAGFDLAERRALLHELMADERLAVDLEDLTGQSDARSDDGGDTGAEPDATPATQDNLRQRLDDGALRARGILQ